MKNIFTWGKNDKNTIKHGVLGLVLFALFLTANYFLTPEQSALLSVLVISCIWEYQQRSLKGVKIDIKDIAVACLAGGLVVITGFVW